MGSIYSFGRYYVFAIVFSGVMALGIFKHGVALGLALGWLPAALVGYLTGLLWPVLVTAAIVLAASASEVPHSVSDTVFSYLSESKPVQESYELSGPYR